MACCSKEYIGIFCKDIGGSVFGFVKFIDGVPTFTYYDTTTWEEYTGNVVFDCDGGAADENTLLGMTLTASAGTTLTDPSLDGIEIFAFGYGNIFYTQDDDWDHTGDTLTLPNPNTFAGGEKVKIFYKIIP